MKPRPKTLINKQLALALILIAGLIFLAKNINATQPQAANLPQYNTQTLSQYDGIAAGKQALLALDGYVYDVSPGRDDFYAPGKPYHGLVGKDSSPELHLVGAEIIRRKYKIVGTYSP